MKLIFKIVEHASKDWRTAVNLREEILRKPLGGKFSEQELEEEKNHTQIVGFIDNELIATAVLVPEYEKLKMQRVVVSNENRNLQIGSKMMGFCEEVALKNGINVIYCHARDSAVNFYLKNGYKREGEYFDEDGIPHLKMVKFLQKETKK